MEITVCDEVMQYPEEVGPLRDSTDLRGNKEALRERLAEDGYLYIRGFHPREKVLAARERILAEMERQGIEAGQHQEMKSIAETPEVMAVLESPALFDFFEDVFGEPALTFDEKWLRAVGKGKATGIHYDNVYMGRGSRRLMTAWTPFGDLPMQLGTLAVCEGSHKEAFGKLQETYGNMDVDRDNIKGMGWYSSSPREVLEKFGGRWVTNDVQAGDVIFITMMTLHGSTKNVTDDVRLSCDIRFQPQSDPADERWAGPNRSGSQLFDKDDATKRTMEEAKSDWGV